MAEPVYTFEVELSANSLTQLQSLCTKASYSRALFDPFTPLNADEGIFELLNDVGSLSPLLNTGLLIGRKVAFSATYGGSSYNLYSGRIKSLSTRPILGERTTVIEALSDVDRLFKTQIDTGIFVKIGANSLFTEIMSLSSVASFTADSDNFDVVPFAWYRDRDGASAVEQLVRSGFYQFYGDGAGTMILKSRYFGTFATSVDTVDVQAHDLNYSISDTGVVNLAHTKATPRIQTSNVATLAYLPSPVALPASGHVGFFVSFLDPRDFQSSVPVGSIETLVSSQDFYAAQNSDGTGTNFTSALSLNLAVFGASLVCSIFNANSAEVFLSRFQVRGYPLLAGTELAVKIDDSSSQALYGAREVNFEDNLFTNYSYLRDLASTIVGDRKEPRDQFDVVMSNEFPQVLQYQVGDILSLINSQTGVNSTWSIRGLHHEVSLSRGLEHVATFKTNRFSPRPWLVLDHPTYGKLDSGRQLAL